MLGGGLLLTIFGVLPTYSEEFREFSRSSVEAIPDSPLTSHPTTYLQPSLPLARLGPLVSPFYRGNIESGSGPHAGISPASPFTLYKTTQPVVVVSTRPHEVSNLGYAEWDFSVKPRPQGHYYGAAKAAFGNTFANLPTGQVPHPLRESVEQLPFDPISYKQARNMRFDEKRQINDLKEFYLSEHGKPFHQSRKHGHLRRKYTYDVDPKDEGKKLNPYKIVCYYGAWSVYRKEPFNFNVSSIDPVACTHVIYSFTGLHNDTLTMISMDEEEDITKGSYKAAIGLKKKNPALKVMIAIGGWNEGGKKYSTMAKTAAGRSRFIDSVVEFLETHGFDGLDLDWEYPGASDRDGGWGDKENFALLVEELSAEFRPRGWLLSAAVSPAKFRVNEGYDVPRISDKLDFINVMTYDLHGSWDNFADHHAPLHSRDHEDWDFKSLNTDGGLSYWHEKGAPLHKLLLGTPFYGRTFKLSNTKKTTPGAGIAGPGLPGKYTEEEGFMAYYEICLKIKEGGWTFKKDSDENPYIYKDDQWIGYDTVEAVQRKMEYVIQKGLGGAMVWAIDLDDYLGVCGRKSPLLTTMNLHLRPLGGPVTEIENGVFGPPKDHELLIAAVTAEKDKVEEEEFAETVVGEKEETVVGEEDNSLDIFPSEPETDFECPSDGFFPSPSNCGEYFQCTQDKTAFSFHCPTGLMWNSEKLICDWPAKVTCPQGKVSPLLYLNSVCLGLSDGLYSDPHNSQEFFNCHSKQLSKMSCAPSLHFDTSTGQCTPGELARIYPGLIVRVDSPSVSYSGAFSDYTGPLSSPLTRAASGTKKVICYFSNWAGLRSGDGQFIPENVDAKLCTHVIYAFAKLDEETLTPVPSGPRSDLDDRYYSRLQSHVKKQNPDAKVMISLGGWADSAGDKYSRLVNSPTNRRNFVAATLQFLKLYGFDGLVLEWHFPVCWQSDCTKGPASDKLGLSILSEMLKSAFSQHGFSLGATLSGYKQVIDVAYNVEQLGNVLDFMNIMTYDFRGFWDGKTGHHAPLYSEGADSLSDFNVNAVMSYYEKKGAPSEKLIVGIPFYGQSFSTKGGATEYGAAAAGPGDAGVHTKQKGMLAFYEICGQVKAGWRKEDGTNNRGPFAHSMAQKQWVGYDDVETVAKKAEYIKLRGYGGAAVWTLDLDDFNNVCCHGANPLLNAISVGLRGVGNTIGGCGKPDAPVTTTLPPRTTTEVWDDGSGNTRPNFPSVTPTRRPTTTTKTTTTTTTSTTTTTERTSTSTTRGAQTPTQPAPAEQDQSSCVEGEYYDNPTNCQMYYRCVNGQLQLQSCAGGLYWKKVEGRCDWAEDVPCNVNLGDNDGIDGSIVTEENLSFTEQTVEGVQSGDTCTAGYSSSEESCSSFYQCLNGEKVLKECADGLHWNKDSETCDWPAQAGCQVTYTDNGPTFRGGCQEGVIMPVQDDCSGYQVCNHGKYVKRKCQAGAYWDQGLQVCNHPGLVDCSPSVSPVLVEVDDNYVEETPDRPSSSSARPTRPTTSASRPATSSTTESSWEDYEYEYKPWTPSTTTTTARPDYTNVSLQGPLSGDYKVVCYFTNWAWYRQGAGKYKPEDIDPTICTHIVYGFAVLDHSNLVIKPHDSWADIDNEFYAKVTEFQKYGIKVTVAIGGWNDSKGDKYSRLVNNAAARKKFIDHVIKFIEKYNFDGLDLDWEYPSCWQTECKEDRYKDKDAFAAWVSELKTAFRARPRELLLSAAVSPSKKIMDVGYDVPSIARDLDWINVMTYDYHGHWDKKTGHVAPFSAHPDDDFSYFNMEYTINYWMELGAPAKKLVLGMPLYGQAFTLDNAATNGLNAPARQKGAAGEFTRAAGFLAYYEICHNIRQGGWTVVSDPEGRMGPYAYKDRQWVGFDDVDTIRRKSEFVREKGLGGGMVWALDLDDFNNRCGQGRHPLMNTIKAVLGPAKGQYSPTRSKEESLSTSGTPGTQLSETVPFREVDTAQEEVIIPEVAPVVFQHEEDDFGTSLDPNNFKAPLDTILEEENPLLEEALLEEKPSLSEEARVTGDKKVVCYFTNWAWYRPGAGKYKPENINSDLCTHIVYGFAVLNPDTLTIRAHDSWADFDNMFYEQVTALKSKNKKVLLALGGWNDSAGKKYSKLVNSPSSRDRFVKHALEFLTKHNFDGLDLDWEYPKCWQVDCSKGPASDKQSFSAWIKELHVAFKPSGLLLTAAVSPSNKVMDEGYEIPELDRYLDYVSIMTYDYHGQWDKKTGHVAPMYQHEDDENVYFNTNFTVHYWLEGGLRPSKLIMGMPMYGQSFTLSSAENNGLNTRTYGGGTAGQFTRARGFLAYYEICDRIQNKGWKVVYDPKGTMGPYAYKGDQWVSFDDARMIEFKSRYVNNMGLGGAMIWALDLDDFNNQCNCGTHPLLETINRELLGRSGSLAECAVFTGNYRLKNLELSPSPYNGCDQGSFASVPGDCASFQVCNNGDYEVHPCPTGLHWNRDKCDWPAAAKCDASADSVTSEESQENNNDDYEDTDDTGDYNGNIVAVAEIVEPVNVPQGIEVPVTGMKVVCYYTNWAWYRQGVGKFKPEDIDYTLCTHINYGFAVLDPTQLIMVPHDTWADVDNNFFTKVADLKKQGVTVSIALGGWNDSEGEKYSRMVNSPSSRAKFIEQAVKFIEKWGFEGLDLDWEYPKCWQVDCSLGPESDKESFTALVRELSSVFRPLGWHLSAAVSPSKTVMDAGYDVPALSQYLDIINVMTYDYHGHWDKKTGHVAPLYEHPEDDYYYFNANYTMNYWAEQGADKAKLVMGMPLYGQSFSLTNRAESSLNAPASGRGEAGEFTRAGGFMAYYEICHKVQSEGWTQVRDPESRMGPYITKGNQWVGYDDIAMIRRKSEFVKNNGFGGGMIWALDLDDFANRCGCENYPLLRTINRVLRDYPTPDPGCDVTKLPRSLLPYTAADTGLPVIKVGETYNEPIVFQELVSDELFY